MATIVMTTKTIMMTILMLMLWIPGLRSASNEDVGVATRVGSCSSNWKQRRIRYFYFFFVRFSLFLFLIEESPFLICAVSIWALPERGGGVVKACQDGLGHFFPTFAQGYKGLPGWFGTLFFHVCPFDTRVGGSKAIWATHFKNFKASLSFSIIHKR